MHFRFTLRLLLLTGLLCYAPLAFSLGPGDVGSGAPADFRGLVSTILSIIWLVIPLLFALTLVVFLWGIMSAWILGGGDEEKVKKGKALALWGVIGLVVMVSVWALVEIVRTTLFGGT